MGDKTYISVALIPAYNEQNSIRDVVNKTREHVDKIIVCDDGSTDNTIQQLDGIDLRLIVNEVNKGYGYSLIQLFIESKKIDADIAITIDADGQHNPKYISSLMAPILENTADMVIGSRFLENEEEQAPWIKRIGIKIINLLIQLGTGLKISDSQSGYRAYNVKKLAALNLHEKGMGISTETLIKCTKRDYRITETPIQIKHYDKIKPLNLVKHAATVLTSTIKYLGE